MRFLPSHRINDCFYNVEGAVPTSVKGSPYVLAKRAKDDELDATEDQDYDGKRRPPFDREPGCDPQRKDDDGVQEPGDGKQEAEG